MRLEGAAWTGKPSNSESILGAMGKAQKDFVRVVTWPESGVTKITLDAVWKVILKGVRMEADQLRDYCENPGKENRVACPGVVSVEIKRCGLIPVYIFESETPGFMLDWLWEEAEKLGIKFREENQQLHLEHDNVEMFFENQMEISDKREIYHSKGLMGFSNFFLWD